jgi:hypothetical protein
MDGVTSGPAVWGPDTLDAVIATPAVIECCSRERAHLGARSNDRHRGNASPAYPSLPSVMLIDRPARIRYPDS